MKITQETKENLEKPNNFLKQQCSSLLLDYRGPRGLFIAQEKMPSHHSRRINRLINGQRSAADPRLEPHFRDRILVVAPMISLTFCYASCAQLELLKGGEYALDQSRFGLPCCGLLNYSFNSFKIPKNWAFFSIKYWT